MSTTYTLNRDQVITGALRLCGVVGQGEAPDATQLSEASEAFNILVKQWAVMGLPLWAIDKFTFSLISSQAEYNSTTLAMADKPLKITNAYVRDIASSTDTPISIISRDEYVRLGGKTSTGIPIQMWYNPELTSTRITVYPTPSASAATDKQIVIYYQTHFNDMTNGSSIVDFPPEWIRPLKWALAADLGEEYSIPQSKKQWIARNAEKAYDEVYGFGQEDGSIFFSIERM